MGRTDYIARLGELLRAGELPPAELDDALRRCNEFITNAPGPEEDTVAGMVPPEQMAEEILADYREARDKRQRGLSLGWKIVLGIILSPFLLGAYSLVAGLVFTGGAAALVGVFSALVGLGASLTGGVATLLVFLGGGLMSVGLGLLLLLFGILLCQGSNWCVSHIFVRKGAAA